MSQYHGVFTVRMNAALHGRMMRWAHANGVSLNAALLRAAEEFLARNEHIYNDFIRCTAKRRNTVDILNENDLKKDYWINARSAIISTV